MLCTTAINTSITIRTQTGAVVRYSSGPDTNSCYHVINYSNQYTSGNKPIRYETRCHFDERQKPTRAVESVRKKTRSSAIAEGPHDASCQLKSCQLPRKSAETTCTTSPEQIEVMKLEGKGRPMCNKQVHSTVTHSSRFHYLIGVELCISPLYRRLAVAKFSKSTI